MSTPAVAFERVTVRFPTPAGEVHTVLRDISLDIAESTFVAIVGPSGCGKSTLLNVAAGLLMPPEGRARIFGEPLQGINRDATYLFQQDALLPWRTVLDNVRLGLVFRNVPEAEATARANHFIERVGLKGFEDRFQHQLSGGMRKRVALARALAYEPAVFLMDEPFSALDANTRIHVGNFFLRIVERFGQSVLFVTHDIDEAVALGDRILVLSRGPGRLVGTFDVNLPRPRDYYKSRFEDGFRDLARSVFELIG